MRTWMLMAALLPVSLWVPAGEAAAPACTEEPSVTVVGSGETSARPDTAELTVGVTSDAASASEALRTNNQAMQQLLQLLTSAGIQGKDVQTVNFAVSPRYEYPRPGGEGKLVGFQATNQVRVTVRKLDVLGSLLDEMVKQGANTLGGVVFSVAESTALEDEARRKAMADARRKAGLYAQAAGLLLGPVVRVDEHAGAAPRPFRPQVMMSRAEATVPVATGEINFREDVTVTFALGALRK
jgi:uncharacterized protein YggE